MKGELKWLRSLEQQVQDLVREHRDMKYSELSTSLATLRSTVNERLIEVLTVEVSECANLNCPPYMSDYQTTVPCGICSRLTRMTGTKRCDGCWELEGRIKMDPASARKILSAIDGGGGKQRCPEMRHVGQCLLDVHTDDKHKFTVEDYKDAR